MAGEAGFTQGGNNILEAAASAGLVPPNPNNIAASAPNPQLEVIKKLLAAGGQGQPTTQPLTTFGTQSPQPNIPAAAEVNAPQVPQGSFQSKGEAQRAQKQATFNNVASIVKQGVNKIHEQKVQSMSADITRLLGSLDGLNEAKAAGNQEAIKHNTDIINMLMDPTTPEGKKRIKAFQKAFNVNLLGESKDTKSPEYQGLLKAYKEYNDKKAKGESALNPIAQRFASAQPQREQLNPALQAEAAAIKAGLSPTANVQMQAAMKQVEILQRAKSSDDKIASAKEIAQLYAGMKDTTSKRQLEGVLSRNLSQAQLAEFKVRSSFEIANMKIKAMSDNLDKRLDLMKQIAGNKQNSDVFNKVYKQSIDLRERMKLNANTIAKSNAELDRLAKLGTWDSLKSGVGSKDIAKIREDGLNATFENNDLKNQLEGVEKQMQLLQGLGLMGVASADDPAAYFPGSGESSEDSDNGDN